MASSTQESALRAHPVQVITSLHNPAIVRARSLHRRKGRHAQGAFLVEGVRSVREALARAAPVRALILCPEMLDEEARAAFAATGHATLRVSEPVMRGLAGTESPQGVVAVVALPERALPALDPRRSLVLVLDGVRDPGNVGTLIRTAAAAGCAAVVTTAGAADAFNPKVVRAAMGAHFHLPVVAEADWDWLGPELATLPAVYGAEMAAATPYDAVDWRGGAALVIGHEDRGLSDEARTWCRARVTIPMPGAFESLNAAVSGAVILFEAVRQRRAAGRR